MKQLATLILACACLGTANAQQFPVRSLGMLNPFQDHPAAAGSRECLDMHMGFRNQWSGFEGAPTTGFANLHGKMQSNGANFSGIGGRIVTDEAAAWSSLMISLAYSYNVKLNNGSRLASGLGLGVFQQRLNWSGIDLPDPQVQVSDDPAFIGTSQLVVPLLDASMWYYNRDFYGGLTLGNITEPSVSEVARSTRLHRYVSATAGAKVEIDGPWTLQPVATIRAAGGIPVAVDLAAFMDYNGLFGIGAGYRNQSALMAMFKVSIADYISVGYAYDWTLSTLNAASPNTHELVIAINACDGNPHGAISCPAYN